VPPMDIPEVGRFCVITDPQGASLSLITLSRERTGA
jgi:predicted enzyme related to lactoylglutathione lyase